MGRLQPLSTPKAAKIAATSRCGQRCGRRRSFEPGPRRTGATFLPRCSIRGKACGHSTNHVTTWASALAQREAVRQGAMRSVEQRLGTWGGPRRNRVTAVQGTGRLDQGRRRDPNRLRPAAEPIDFGNEPPLLMDGATIGLIDRRRVSVQWFSGTILTGLCGAALMGGAVFIALDGEANFAALPERVEAALRGTLPASAPQPSCARATSFRPPAKRTRRAR